MKRSLPLTFWLLIFTTAGFAQGPPVVGICPFIDDTATPAGDRSGTMLPVMFLDQAKSAGFLAIIVNPGPNAAPGDTEWPVELARTLGADAVLVGQVRALATSGGKKPSAETLRGHVLLSSHAADLVLTGTLVATVDGRQLGTLQTAELVKGSWLTEAAGKVTGIHHESFWFANTQLGQAIGRSAEKLVADVAQRLSQVQPSGAYKPVAAGRNCRVTVQVRYKAKDRASKAYSVAVNGKEESLGVNDGKVEVEEPAGPILLHVTVNDAPYRQPVQDTYYANSMLDCSRDANTLLFEIGSTGEGVIRWQ
jgi:hypothetical protein